MRELSTQQLIEDIARSVSPSEFDSVARNSLAAFDALSSEGIQERKIKLDCCEGCSLCCWLRVDVFAHEVFPIVNHIRRTFAPEAVLGLMLRLRAHADVVRSLTPFEHATSNIPCPLLHEGKCTVYEVRPHSCRRHHSRDFAACQYTFDHPEDLQTPAAHDRELFQTLSGAMRKNIEAYAESGFDHTIYELGTALHEALSDTSSWERWRRHERAFHDASVTPSE